jgi:hypothetical protein
MYSFSYVLLGCAGDAGLFGNRLVGLNVDLHPLGSPSKVLKHPLELGFEHRGKGRNWGMNRPPAEGRSQS